jgi:hypothetical protein
VHIPSALPEIVHDFPAAEEERPHPGIAWSVPDSGQAVKSGETGVITGMPATAVVNDKVKGTFAGGTPFITPGQKSGGEVLYFNPTTRHSLKIG